MANVIPLAGLGSRFDKEGYKLPKPLIPVSGEPMILKAVRQLPKSDKWIFIVRKEHIDNYKIDELIKSEIPDAIVISVEKNTEGQACTCLLAEPYLDLEEELFIAPCDSTFLLDKEKFNNLKASEEIGAVFFTLTQRKILEINPNAWGWYNLEEGNETIKDISIKIPVSATPFNDHAVTATFYFKKARDFIDSTKLMIKENYRINNEFYVDALPKFLEKLGKKSVICDVDLYVSWNKPEDLHDFERIEFIVKNKLNPESLNEEEKRLLPLWKKYLENEKNRV
ncbi:MAG: nucleotidyltransferase [Nanoarchaeota archaeon]